MKRSERSRNAGTFVVGHDPRRHIFTEDERRRGGHTTWNRYMRRWHAECIESSAVMRQMAATDSAVAAAG
jgi:hypothetical protein